MVRFAKWLVIVLGAFALVAVVWFGREEGQKVQIPVPPESSFSETVPPPSTSVPKKGAPVNELPKLDQAETPPKDEPLNLRMPENNSTSFREGPQVKAVDAPISKPEIEPSINDLLPDKPIEKQKFNYSYEGMDKDDEDKYNLKLGIQDEEVKVDVGVGVQTEEKRTDLNSINIEIKLPQSAK